GDGHPHCHAGLPAADGYPDAARSADAHPDGRGRPHRDADPRLPDLHADGDEYAAADRHGDRHGDRHPYTDAHPGPADGYAQQRVPDADAHPGPADGYAQQRVPDADDRADGHTDRVGVPEAVTTPR
ncbi:MAG: hypothetical protein KIS91_11130, partial [Anaerolineae bacterium]|nr:hypothetical protein [Anaerolineae bacterium]